MCASVVFNTKPQTRQDKKNKAYLSIDYKQLIVSEIFNSALFFNEI